MGSLRPGRAHNSHTMAVHRVAKSGERTHKLGRAKMLVMHIKASYQHLETKDRQSSKNMHSSKYQQFVGKLAIIKAS